uniref:Uncharacterized protein n=1 Tax=Oryza brachyantha TaxID=4533 RepID=J3MB69_ORYBR
FNYLDVSFVQDPVQLCKCIQATRVDRCHSTHVEDDASDRALVRLESPLFFLPEKPHDPLDEVHGVGEVDRRLDADDEEGRHPHGLPVLHHAPVALRAGDDALDHHVRPGHLQQDLEQRDADGDGEAHLDGDEEDAEEGGHAGQEVELVNLPELGGALEVDEADHRRDDDRRQDHVGGVVEQRHQEQQRHQHRRRHHDVRHRRLAPGAVVHRRPRERSCIHRCQAHEPAMFMTPMAIISLFPSTW